MSENENCLAGIRCPKCGSAEKFRIAVTAWFDFDDDGGEPSDNCEAEWDDGSSIRCLKCKHQGTVAKFTE